MDDNRLSPPIPSHIAKTHLEMVRLAFKKGEEERAVAAVRRAFQETRDESKTCLSTSVRAFLTVRLANALESIGVMTAADLLRTTPLELQQRAGIGPISSDYARKKLRQAGFDWDEHFDDDDANT